MIKMSKLLVLVQNSSIINKIKEVEKATFLFPLEGYSVGYPVTYKLSDIMDGDLDSLVLPVIEEHQANMLAELANEN